MPLLINPDGSKLSKRAGDVKVEDYIARGYEPEALLNFVALMGWSPQGSETLGEGTSEVMSPQELIDQVRSDLPSHIHVISAGADDKKYF